MDHRRIDKSKGILNPRAGEKRFRLSRHAPAEDLAFFIDRYWIVRWDLDGQEAFTQETLPYPCVNMVIEADRSGIFGVVRQKFARRLEGKGRVLGVKFRPGGFYPFLQSSITALTDRSIPLTDAFGVDGEALEAAVLAADDSEGMMAEMERFLRPRLPERDDNVVRVNRIVDCIATDRFITKVKHIVRRIEVSKRTLQRLFRRYVGVGPKWVIQRYRLQEAVDRLADGEAVDWTQMALDLGYFDQAHFVNDFRALVGVAPTDYAREVRSSA